MSIEEDQQEERDAFIRKVAQSIADELRADPMADGMFQHLRKHLDREPFDLTDIIQADGAAHRKHRT